jgi:hypothetical protein
VIAPIRIVIKIRLQKIWKEKDFKDNEHDKKLDQYDQPNLLTPSGKI